MCFLALLTFVMAMLVCVIWIVPGIYMDTVIIASNDTIMAAYEVDPQTTESIVYSLPEMAGEHLENVSDEELVFYRKVCDYLKPSSVQVHISEVYNVTADVERMGIGHLYLANQSSLDYVVNVTLSSPAAKVPQECFASVHLFQDYSDLASFLSSNDTGNAISSHQFCDSSTLRFKLNVRKTASYYFLGLYAANRGQVKSAGIRVDGTIFYYDTTLLGDDIVCHFSPSVNTSCTVPIGHVKDYQNLCILITRGTPNIPGADPITVAMGNKGATSNYIEDEIIQFDRMITTYWGLNRVAVFVCLFAPLMMSCCVLTILTPRRTNYGSYVRTNKKKPVDL